MGGGSGAASRIRATLRACLCPPRYGGTHRRTRRSPTGGGSSAARAARDAARGAPPSSPSREGDAAGELQHGARAGRRAASVGRNIAFAGRCTSSGPAEPACPMCVTVISRAMCVGHSCGDRVWACAACIARIRCGREAAPQCLWEWNTYAVSWARDDVRWVCPSSFVRALRVLRRGVVLWRDVPVPRARFVCVLT